MGRGRAIVTEIQERPEAVCAGRGVVPVGQTGHRLHSDESVRQKVCDGDAFGFLHGAPGALA